MIKVPLAVRNSGGKIAWPEEPVNFPPVIGSPGSYTCPGTIGVPPVIGSPPVIAFPGVIGVPGLINSPA